MRRFCFLVFGYVGCKVSTQSFYDLHDVSQKETLDDFPTEVNTFFNMFFELYNFILNLRPFRVTEVWEFEQENFPYFSLDEHAVHFRVTPVYISLVGSVSQLHWRQISNGVPPAFNVKMSQSTKQLHKEMVFPELQPHPTPLRWTDWHQSFQQATKNLKKIFLSWHFVWNLQYSS